MRKKNRRFSFISGGEGIKSASVLRKKKGKEKTKWILWWEKKKNTNKSDLSSKEGGKTEANTDWGGKGLKGDLKPPLKAEEKSA